MGGSSGEVVLKVTLCLGATITTKRPALGNFLKSGRVLHHKLAFRAEERQFWSPRALGASAWATSSLSHVNELRGRPRVARPGHASRSSSISRRPSRIWL